MSRSDSVRSEGRGGGARVFEGFCQNGNVAAAAGGLLVNPTKGQVAQSGAGRFQGAPPAGCPRGASFSPVGDTPPLRSESLTRPFQALWHGGDTPVLVNLINRPALLRRRPARPRAVGQSRRAGGGDPQCRGGAQRDGGDP
ncbi:MAG: hypothetical protein GY835_28410 [bacterium]|nr:hypothetical protein [bacterium]